MVNIPPMETFALAAIGKTILKIAVHVIEKLYTKFNKLKLNQLLLTNTILKIPRKFG